MPIVADALSNFVACGLSVRFGAASVFRINDHRRMRLNNQSELPGTPNTEPLGRWTYLQVLRSGRCNRIGHIFNRTCPPSMNSKTCARLCLILVSASLRWRTNLVSIHIPLATAANNKTAQRQFRPRKISPKPCFYASVPTFSSDYKALAVVRPEGRGWDEIPLERRPFSRDNFPAQ